MLADATDAAALESYLGEAGRQLGRESLLTYAMGTGEKKRIGVVYGDFGSRKEAQAELSRLTTRIGQFRPYARTFQAVREDAKSGK
jgi:septal ring-binding cell division protein DamX